MDSFNPPEINLKDFDNLHEELIDMQRTVIVCTIFVCSAILIILPTLLYIFLRKTNKGLWLLNEKTTNLLEYYENIPEVECSNKKTIV